MNYFPRFGLFFVFAHSVLAVTSTVRDPEIVPPANTRLETVKVENIPAYVPRRLGDGTFEILKRKDLVAELRLVTSIPFNERGTNPLPPPLPRITCRFEEYSVVDHEWFRQYMKWFRFELDHLGLSYRKESWDCDDFSTALNALADLAMIKSEFHTAPHLIGRLVVQQQHAWAGTKAGGLHEIIIFRSDQAWWVAEPQNGALISLWEYPNRTSIREILFN